MLLLAVPTSSWAQYITDLAIGVGRGGKPQDELQRQGYKIDGVDLNRGATGSQDVFMGWKSTDNPKQAITNIVVVAVSKESDAPDNTCTFDDGRLYYRAKDIMGISDDLNKGAGGDFLYLYYTMEKPERGYVTEIKFEGSKSTCASPICLVEGKHIGTLAANFNKGAKGDNIYYSLKKKVVVESSVPKLQEVFNAESLGGRLYKLTIPLGCIDDNGDTHVLGDGGPGRDGVVYFTDETNTEDSLFTMTFVNAFDYDPSTGKDIENKNHDDDFQNPWCYTASYKGQTGQDKLSIVAPKTLEKYTGANKYKDYSSEGNDADLRFVTIFLMANNDTTVIKSFRYRAGGMTNYSYQTNFTLDITAPVNPPEAPEDMNTINVLEPVFDITAGKSGSTARIGSQQVNVITAGMMDWIGVWDAEKHEFMFSGENSTKNNQLNYTFPPEDKAKHYTALLWGENKMITDKGLSSNKGWFAVPFTIKPVHSIKEMSVSFEKEVDKNGDFQQYNKVQWTVDHANDEDAIDVDEYIIQRAELPDFSDAITIGSISVDAASADSTSLRIEGEKGIYTYVDDLEGNAYNTKGGKRLYYRVIRAVVLANWGSLMYGDFVNTHSVSINNYLAAVDHLSLKKTDSFEQDGIVKVRVELKNGEVAGISNEIRPYRSDTSPEEDFVIWNDPQQKYIGKVTNDSTELCSDRKDAQHFTLRRDDDTNRFYILNERNHNQSLTVNTAGKNISWSDYSQNAYYTFAAENGLFRIIYQLPGTIGHESVDLGLNSEIRPVGWTHSISPEWKMIRSYAPEYVWDKNASIVIKRYSEERDTIIGTDGSKTTVDLAAKTITINGADVKWDAEKKTYYAEIEDIQTLPYTHYYYMASVDGSNSKFPVMNNDTVATTKEEADACTKTTLAPVAHLEATMGTQKGGVAIEWEAEEGLLDRFKLERREYSKDNSNSFEELPLKDAKVTSFFDNRAPSGKLFEYKVTTQCTVYGKTHEASRTVYGWNPYYGTVRGRVTLKNGAMMPSKVRIDIKGTEPVQIAEVRDPVTDEVIIPKFDGVYKNECIAEKGTFEFDSIPYLSQGTRYSVEISAQGAEFVLEGQEDTKTTLSLTDESYEYSTLHYICNDTRQFSGRVLYKNSTIPVRDCKFEVNGSEVLDASGNAVVTDSKGEFMFLLPAVEMNLRVVKDGHTFADDGYILGREGDRKEDDEHAFTPADDYDGLILTDNTTVRLVGRLIGGNNQGRLPFAMALSKNNLGDNMRLVMELEGDNTSHITYFKEDPNKSSYSQTFTQQINVAKASGNSVIEVDSTNVTFEKKRIVIEPNVTTGEFCIDLAPTKYKITEMSAEGYSTLFNDGEGFQVLDLSRSDTCYVTDTQTVADKKTYVEETLTTSYNATYQRVVHNPVTITYDQYQYGMKKNFFGMEKMTTINAVGKKVKTTIAKYDKDTKKTTYMFGHPVYEVGRDYQLKVDVHEDYYYNGDKKSVPDIVYLDSCTLKIRNELVSNECVEEYELTPAMNGSLTFSFVADNPEFTLKKDAALRHLTMQANVNGYYYDAEPLVAFVTGVRDKGMDVLATIDGPINIVDVIRDPYGSKSYAYREKGTTYHWDYNQKIDFSLGTKFNFSFGAAMSWFTGIWTGTGAGAFAGEPGSTHSSNPLSVNLPLIDWSYTEKGEYDMTLNDRVSTSADPLDVGAMADVYLGFTTSYDLNRVETFSLIDQETYDLMKRGVDANAIRIIQEGEDENGEKFYLAVSDKVTIGQKKTRDFAYTQKHIIGTIIPQLIQELDKKLLTGTHDEIQELADASNEVLYRYIESSNEFEYETIYPHGIEIEVKSQLTPTSYLQAITGWKDVIKNNEEQKLHHITKSDAKPKSYSLSAASKIEHSETASMSYVPGKQKIALGGLTFNGENAWEWNSSIGLGGSPTIKVLEKFEKQVNKKSKENTDTTTNKTYVAEIQVSGHKFTMSVTPNYHFNYDKAMAKKVIFSQGSGYVLETNDNSYLDIDVYQSDDYNLDREFVNLANKEAKNQTDDEKSDFQDRFWNWVAGNPEETKVCRLNDFVFTVRGGAERQPWYAPDSTFFYADPTTKKGYPLTSRTLRIDNPKISISNPVVSNIPVGDKAIFSVRLTNDSEVTTNMNTELINPSPFRLFLDEKSCPDGLTITMDGMPLTDGRLFYLKPGESITKTIQVERAGKQYNYENVRLGFRDEGCSLFDYAAISVNYLPASTPVKMVRPVDKWVMNTLSAKDNEGRYYLPVEVNGFNTHYDNFDHIELQYKKKTEGDSKWVNMCSFYANDSLFHAASGTKKMLETGTINYRFYGEADPIEMEYDLRAVSFCRLGTGYVTAVSNVMSGLKDTRNPEIFGKPKPTNGVLTFEDVISFPFNEPIAYNYLDKTANFQITGLTNNLNKVYDTALRFSEFSASDAPASKVKRSLAGQDFTWEAMIQLDGNSMAHELLSIYDTDISKSATSRYFTLMYDSCALVATMDGVAFSSKKLTNEQDESLNSKLTNVAVSFTNDTVGIKKQLRFYVNGTEVEMDKVERLDTINFEEGKNALMEVSKDYHITSNVYGRIFLGTYMNGLMVDARLWNKALSGAELASKRMKVLSSSEPSLMCYWPMDEMTGNVLHDKVNGTDIHFSRQTWQMPDGQYSLRVNGESIKLKAQDTDFMRAEYNDFTLSFWTQIDSEQTKADTVCIFNAGSQFDKQHFAIYMDKENVNVKSGEFCQSFASRSELADNKWHLVTAVTNKSYNTSSIYLDGELVMIAGGDAFNGMPKLVSIGDENFHGNFDCITFWHLALPNNNLTTVSNAAPTGREMGLAFFMPFEMDQMNPQGIHESVFSPCNMVVKKDEEGKELSTHDIALSDDMLSKIEQLENRDSYPPVRSSSIIQNIPFTWTATNNELQINLNKRDAEINHQYVNVTIRDVEDLAGNTLVNPQMMRVYVDRNVLNWEGSKVDINVKYGESETITCKLNNKSGRKIYYTLENNSTWLKLSETSGEATPLNYDEIEMEVSDGLAPGEYSTTVYAVDEDNLGSPLTVRVNVMADEPEWTVTDAQDYNYTMNIMGRVKLRNEGGHEYFDTDKRDIVAAFYNGVCVGKANITVNDVNNPIVNLTVLGNKDMNKKNLTFLLWNAATNTTSVIVSDTGNIAFVNGSLVGCPPAEPVNFITTNEKKQTWNLETGWNWVSLNIKPKNTSINKLFDSNDVFSAGDVIMVNGKSSEMSAKKSWSSGVSADDKYTFQIYVQKPVKATVYGYEFKEAERYVTLKAAPKNGAVWCHLPYLLNVDQPINVVMSGLADNKNNEVGTVIKDRKKFAVLNNDKKWVGSLDYMHPGEGYFIKYLGKDTINVAFTNNEKPAYTKLASWSDNEDDAVIVSQVETATSEARTMMPVIASIANDADFEEDDEIVAFAKGNAIGSAKVTELEDGKQLFFISLNAEDGNIVRFAHVRGNEVLAKSRNGIVYDGNAVTGTLDVPYTIDFSDYVSDNDDAYGISGEKYGKAEDIKNRKGVFIIGNEKIAQ